MNSIEKKLCEATLCCLVAPVLLLCLSVVAIGQDSALPAAVQTAEGAAGRYAAKYSEFKKLARDIEQLRSDFQLANEAKREQIGGQLTKLVASAGAAMEAMVAEGVEAYRANPEGDPQLTELLVSVAQFQVVGQARDSKGSYRSGGDRYEKAIPIVQALIEGGAEQQNVPLWGFVCAFMANDYDQAEEYLELAKERGALVDPSTIEEPAQKAFMESAWKFAASLDVYRELWTKEEAIRAAEAVADDLPRVKLTTNKGEIVIELFENEAPIAVANFITLVKKGFYDGLSFHRVLPGFMAQGGCPLGTGTGGPGYQIRCECYEPNARKPFRKHFRGSLSMAHGGQDTAGSQFFLTFVPTDHLDGKHTVFGRVIEGIEVLGNLQHRNPSGEGESPTPDRIEKAEVLRDRGHDYSFPKLPSR